MPTYDYRCAQCGHEYELFQSMKDKPKRKCPACGKNGLERLIGTGAGVIFKGSGFYETDYRSDSYKKGAEAEKKVSEPAKGDSKTDKSADKSKDSSSDKKQSSADASSSAGGGAGCACAARAAGSS